MNNSYTTSTCIVFYDSVSRSYYDPLNPIHITRAPSMFPDTNEWSYKQLCARWKNILKKEGKKCA